MTGYVADVTAEYTSFTWRNFSVANDADNDERRDSHPYWNYVPEVRRELREMTEADWREPKVYDLVLTRMWKKYVNSPAHKWKHFRIRAEEDRVAVNARSVRSGDDGSAGLERMEGLEKLAARLAKTALKQSGITDTGAEGRAMCAALLRTLIRDWSPKSYEFFFEPRLEHIEDARKRRMEQRKASLHVHCYFGARPGERSKDCFAHYHCMSDTGESSQALRILLKELEP